MAEPAWRRAPPPGRLSRGGRVGSVLLRPGLPSDRGPSQVWRPPWPHPWAAPVPATLPRASLETEAAAQVLLSLGSSHALLLPSGSVTYPMQGPGSLRLGSQGTDSSQWREGRSEGAATGLGRVPGRQNAGRAFLGAGGFLNPSVLFSCSVMSNSL